MTTTVDATTSVVTPLLAAGVITAVRFPVDMHGFPYVFNQSTDNVDVIRGTGTAITDVADPVAHADGVRRIPAGLGRTLSGGSSPQLDSGKRHIIKLLSATGGYVQVELDQ